MEGFTLENLRAAVELSSVCFGVLHEATGRITAPNQALRQRVGRTEFSVVIVANESGRMYGRLEEENWPVSLRVLSAGPAERDENGDVSGSSVCLVEVYLANAERKDVTAPHTSDLIQLVDMTSDGVWEWFPSLNYEFMSERFWSILGYDHRVMPSSPDAWMSIIDPSGLATAKRMFDSHVATKGATQYNLNVCYTHKKGHEVQVKCRGAVVEWLPDGTPWRLLGTHTDITEIMEAVDAKSRFVSRMSHEIRTPICAILHETELLEENSGTAVIADACDQLLSLCNDILTVDKLRRPQAMSATRRSADVADFFRKALRRHAGEAHKKGVGLDGTVESQPPPSTPLMIDVSKCNQVVDNLVSNAIKYTEAGGTVCVELRCRPKVDPSSAPAYDPSATRRRSTGGQEVSEEWQVGIVVRDNGLGIHPDDREFVFDRFSQANSSMQGAGLGLSISKELAQLMSGDVLLRSADVGKGSTFEFTFPACTSAMSGVSKATSSTSSSARSISAGRRSDADAGGGGEQVCKVKPIIRVLSADDMLTNRKIMRRRLRAIEEQLAVVVIDVVDAVDGRDAVRVFREANGKIDLVFMDCLMPEMNGFEASKEIHLLCDEWGTPRVPVVAVTASVSTSLHEECREAGMEHVVTKPFDLMDLMPVFEAAMNARQRRELGLSANASEEVSREPPSPVSVPRCSGSTSSSHSNLNLNLNSSSSPSSSKSSMLSTPSTLGGPADDSPLTNRSPSNNTKANDIKKARVLLSRNSSRPKTNNEVAREVGRGRNRSQVAEESE